MKLLKNQYGKLFANKTLKAFHIDGDKVKCIANLAADLTDSEEPDARKYAEKLFQLLGDYEEILAN